MSSQANPQLQRRAGRNFPGFLGVISGQNCDSFKMSSTDLVLAEPKGDEIVLPAGPALLTAGFSCKLFNSSGVALDFDLVFVDEFGSEYVCDTASAVADGATDTLSPPTFLYLKEGEKLILRVTSGNPLGGNGVHVTRAMTTAPQSILFDAKTYKLTVPELVLAPPEGVSAVGSYFGFINHSPGNVSVAQYRRFDLDGFDFPNPAAPSVIAAGAAQLFTDGNYAHDASLVLKVASLPASGYVLVKESLTYPQNGFPLDPQP